MAILDDYNMNSRVAKGCYSEESDNDSILSLTAWKETQVPMKTISIMEFSLLEYEDVNITQSSEPMCSQQCLCVIL
jgi:hypothetical protein